MIKANIDDGITSIEMAGTAGTLLKEMTLLVCTSLKRMPLERTDGTKPTDTDKIIEFGQQLILFGMHLKEERENHEKT